MLKKSIVVLSVVPLLTFSSASFATNSSSIEKAVDLIASGDVKYIASVVLSKLPASVIKAAPESFVTYNALRIKGNGHGFGGGVGGGRWHKC